MKHFLLALVATLLIAPAAHASNFLINGDFESASLSPWYAGNSQYQNATPSYVRPWQISTFAHGGSYSAMDNGNIELRQDLGYGVSTASVTSLNLWLYDAAGGCGCNAFDLYFTDGTYLQDAVFPTTGQWVYENLLFSVPANEIVSGFSIYGNDSGVNCGACGTVYVDDIVLDPPPDAQRYPVMPEPSALTLLGSSLLLGAGVIGFRKRRRSVGERAA